MPLLAGVAALAAWLAGCRGERGEEAPTGAPILETQVEPADGAVVRGREAWIRWTSPGPVAGRVRWREAGEEDFRVAEAGRGHELVARLGPLEEARTYEYVVESAGSGALRRSALRRFRVAGGLAFEPASVEATVRRDYDQRVSLRLRNASGDTVQVGARTLRRFADLPAGVVGPGSADQPVRLAPGAVLPLTLAVAAPDARAAVYEIPIEAGGAFTVARVTVTQPKVALALRVVAQDTVTLSQTLELRNEGDALADLAVRVAAPHAPEVRLEPAAQHANLFAGQSLELVATPVLYLEFQSLSVELEASAAGRSVRFPLEFRAPEGARLMGLRTGSQSRGSSSDWYCTNKPRTCSEVPGPAGNGPVLLASAGPVAPPDSGACDPSRCDKGSACEAIAEMQAAIRRGEAQSADPSSFQRWAREFDPALQDLSEALACRFNTGDDALPGAATLQDFVGQIHRDRFGLRTLDEQDGFPTRASCPDPTLGRPIRPAHVDVCADLDALGRIGQNLSGLAGVIGCPGPPAAGGPPRTSCEQLVNPLLDGLQTFFDQVDDLKRKNQLGSGDAYDQVADGIESAIDELEGVAEEIEGVGGDAAHRARDAQDRINKLKELLDAWAKVKAASCLPPEVQQLLRQLADRKRSGAPHEDTCTELCGETSDWYVEITGAQPLQHPFFVSCSMTCF